MLAKLDLKDAYWQIPLDKRSREVVTINTTKGLYQFNRLPKGLKTSSFIFQRVIEEILSGIDGLVVYQDDILVYAKSSSELARRVSSIIQRLEQKSVTINSEKSILNATRVKFLGHVLTPEGIIPDPDIVKKIMSLNAPSDRKELESFLGLMNFFGRMIPGFANLTQPLHGLRKKDVQFVWTEKHQASFDELLKQLSKPPILQSYDLSKPVVLTTDASEVAIAGILSQEGKPVMFVSRALSKAEQRYSNIEREALAVVWSCMRLRQLLLGRHFTLESDHKPLMKIFDGPQLPKVASARLMRWAILLQQFDFHLKYSEGKTIPHADCLTRMKLLSDDSLNEDIVINDVEDHGVSGEILNAVKFAIKTDTVANSIMNRVKDNNWSYLKPPERPFFRVRHHLRIDDHVLWLANRCYLPSQLRRDALKVAHEMHSGIQSTLYRLRQSAWWPTIRRDTADYIRHCSTCQQTGPKFLKQQSSWPLAGVFGRVHADWCHVPSVGNVLLMVDSKSGWIEA